MAIRRILNSAKVRLNRRMNDLSPEEAARSKKDLAAVVQRFPKLDQFDAKAPTCESRLAADHADYIENVGHPVHAASLELAVFLELFCEDMKPKRLADLGSGFSSYVLRAWANKQTDVPEVWSVDDSAQWLEKTRGYLKAQDVGDERLCTWNDFIDAEKGEFDLVLHDMGSMEFRAETLQKVLDLVRPGGLVILDDMHKPEFREYALTALVDAGMDHYSLKALTRDSLTRYAYLVVV